MNANRSFLAIAVFVVFCFPMAAESHAQRNDRRALLYNSTYQPTLSPYLNLLRDDTGVLPNYHQFYRPRVQTQRALEQQLGQIDRQQRQLNTVERRVGQLRRAGADLTTGVRAGFLDYSHFYPALDQD